MTSAAILLQEERTNAGLSRKALAARAGMPTSTVSRMEDGTNSPTIETLERVLDAVGRRLILTTAPRPNGPSLASLHDAWKAHDDDADWTRFRAFVDHLARHSEQVNDAISVRPRRTANDRLDNLLAAVAEKTADDHGVARPRWTAAVEVLNETWVSAGTPAMRRRERNRAPRQFAERGIHLAATNVWRSRD